ncbi:MAG: phage integrase N-terminal SAM-like domain-containing protein [candidate division Zixibacteria bacterium]|nr:phage integrase N-terminal SAM-like domain-containing protein [candidate division Zixibacteria bacterium]
MFFADFLSIHYSIRTEEAYVSWIKRYIYFYSMRHPNDMGRKEIEAFLTDLAVKGNVSASTRLLWGRAAITY